jgi:hypothetical protein
MPHIRAASLAESNAASPSRSVSSAVAISETPSFSGLSQSRFSSCYFPSWILILSSLLDIVFSEIIPPAPFRHGSRLWRGNQ